MSRKEFLVPPWFKTEMCEFVKNGIVCQHASQCLYYHNEEQRRRPPVTGIINELGTKTYSWKYIPKWCKHLQPDSVGKMPKKCPFGDNCYYAHTLNEILYHPLLYKTRKCKNGLGCKRINVCAYVHILPDGSPALHASKNTYPPLPPPVILQNPRNINPYSILDSAKRS
uniref:C3H1-type domain-containing protein n=1 Tax=viral metagenome TaxID=1070528 RepID=A0A6C0CLB1_9ZZZZ